MNRSFNLKLVTLDLVRVRSEVGSHLFITRGSSLWSRFIGYNETIDIDHGSVKLASQLLVQVLLQVYFFLFIANVITYRL